MSDYEYHESCWPEVLMFGAMMMIGVGLLVWGILGVSNVDNINNRFTNQCDLRGGTTVIDDKDLCISPDGLVLFHE